MNWSKSDIDPAAVRDSAARYGLDLLTSSILYRRNVRKPSDFCFWLEDDIRFMHNPFLFDHMDDVVDRISRAREEGERVMVFGDRDVDGITSTVIMTECLREFGLDVEWNLPRGDERYGLTIGAIDDFASRDGSLIVTVDCGISNFDEVAHANSLGIDTIVLDHHTAPENLPDAVAIINPKVPDESYPFRDLSGCGVAFKTAWALRFSQTVWYNNPVCLLNVRPGNGDFIFEAVKLLNLTVIDRVIEHVVPGVLNLEQSRLKNFLVGYEILGFDIPQQIKILQRVFGPNTDIGLIDVKDEIAQAFPPLAGKSLLRLREMSRIVRYTEGDVEEIDVLANLFISLAMKKSEKLTEAITRDMDMAALGTIADLMPLQDENRIIVKRGLEVVNTARRPGLQELLLQLNLIGRKLTTTDIAWQVSPIINASGRMGQPELAAELFLSQDPQARTQLARNLIDLNTERKRVGDSSWEIAYPQAVESLEKYGNRMVIVCDPGIHRGITGILASKLLAAFNLPSLVMTPLEEEIVGSLRSKKDFPVRSFLDQLSRFFIDYGGHECAAGFRISHDNLEPFLTAAAELLPCMDLGPAAEETIEVDAEIPLAHMTPQLVDLVDRFEPYGEGNPRFTFLVKNLTIASLDLMGKKEQQHVRILFDSGENKWPAVFWKAGDRVNRDFSQGDTVDALFTVGKNFYQNTETVQLTVLEIT